MIELDDLVRKIGAFFFIAAATNGFDRKLEGMNDEVDRAPDVADVVVAVVSLVMHEVG